MTVTGFMIKFSCGNGEQYERIGAFWKAMSDCYPLETLDGIGYGWENDTLNYMIGRIDSELPNDITPLKEFFPQAQYAKIQLPDEGWISYRGKTDALDQLYAKVYQEGPLDFEIENFHEDGTCMVRIFRNCPD